LFVNKCHTLFFSLGVRLAVNNEEAVPQLDVSIGTILPCNPWLSGQEWSAWQQLHSGWHQWR